MAREITREGLEAEAEALTYPALRPDAAVALADVTLALEERAVNLGELVSGTEVDAFGDPEELVAAVEDVLADPELR